MEFRMARAAGEGSESSSGEIVEGGLGELKMQLSCSSCGNVIEHHRKLNQKSINFNRIVRTEGFWTRVKKIFEK
jgi:hypothetical protein